MPASLTYLFLDTFTLLFPLLLSFDKKVAFYKHWKALLPAIAVTGAVFIGWDVYFTHLGVWSFNPEYLIGIDLVNLPIEEWLFFLVVPYACIFILKCYQGYFKLKISDRVLPFVLLALIGAFTAIALLNLERIYTAVTLLFTAAWLVLHWVLFKLDELSDFLLSYLIALIPFLLVNGVLTALPVVSYDDSENLGMRIGTIPVEDSIYGFLLILMTFTFMKLFAKRS